MNKQYIATGTVSLSPDLAAKGIIRIPSSQIDGKGCDPDKFSRDEIVVLHNLSNGRKVYRKVWGSPSARSTSSSETDRFKVKANTIALDYATSQGLGLHNDDVGVEVTRASVFGRLAYRWDHPDDATRFSNRGLVVSIPASIISLFLGVLGVVLAVI